MTSPTPLLSPKREKRGIQGDWQKTAILIPLPPPPPLIEEGKGGFGSAE